MKKHEGLKILHFNDVYDLEERKANSTTGEGRQIVAGAARFVTAME